MKRSYWLTTLLAGATRIECGVASIDVVVDYVNLSETCARARGSGIESMVRGEDKYKSVMQSIIPWGGYSTSRYVLPLRTAEQAPTVAVAMQLNMVTLALGHPSKCARHHLSVRKR